MSFSSVVVACTGLRRFWMWPKILLQGVDALFGNTRPKTAQILSDRHENFWGCSQWRVTATYVDSVRYVDILMRLVEKRGICIVDITFVYALFDDKVRIQSQNTMPFMSTVPFMTTRSPCHIIPDGSQYCFLAQFDYSLKDYRCVNTIWYKLITSWATAPLRLIE